MVPEAAAEELVTFFKSLADINRLRILGLLAEKPHSVEELAEILRLGASTVSHHLARLARAGLVSAKAQGYYSIYRLEPAALHAMAKRVLRVDQLPALAADLDASAYDRKVINTFMTGDGRIKAFPAQEKKLRVLLARVVQAFEPGVRYSEKQVNRILKRFNEDSAFLRRWLVECGFMDREGGGGAYWRTDQPFNP
ncbi:MAG TPA: metalloregulator ArsR/SmtB family transcription factor [Desulfuromonadaceae bacterium]